MKKFWRVVLSGLFFLLVLIPLALLGTCAILGGGESIFSGFWQNLAIPATRSRSGFELTSVVGFGFGVIFIAVGVLLLMATKFIFRRYRNRHAKIEGEDENETS